MTHYSMCLLTVHPVVLNNRSRDRRIVMYKTLFASCLWYALCFVPTPLLASYNYLGSAELMAWMRNLYLIGWSGIPVKVFVAFTCLRLK